MKNDAVKGFRDFTGDEAVKRAEIKKIIVDTFEKFGFEPAETPVIENEEFVKGDNKNDEAVSDIYKLQDKRKRELALRYEFTFQLKRLMKNKKLPYRRYQIGEVFRDEPAGANRFRQITQCDADVVGATIKEEAEILALANEIFNKLKIKKVIYVGSRKILNEIFEEQKISATAKEQVMREIDKIDKLPEKEIRANLKKFGAGKLIDIFKKPESYFKKYNSYKEIEELKKYCGYFSIDIKFSPSLVRGLSYYNGTVFEIKSADKKNKETIAGGGVYSAGEVQAVGIAFGLERISTLADLDFKKDKYLVISLNQDKEAVKLSQKLRQQNKIASLYYGKPSKALEYANSCDFQRVIFIGEKEVREKKLKVKDMKTGRESLLKI
ncbi:MAG: ATP phosphoribosyltransferase regulatory subunit [archaeon]